MRTSRPPTSAPSPEDEGRWMLHCHILEHAESGMMTVVEVD